jgi:hypothetical protein
MTMGKDRMNVLPRSARHSPRPWSIFRVYRKEHMSLGSTGKRRQRSLSALVKIRISLQPFIGNPHDELAYWTVGVTA